MSYKQTTDGMTAFFQTCNALIKLNIFSAQVLVRAFVLFYLYEKIFPGSLQSYEPGNGYFPASILYHLTTYNYYVFAALIIPYVWTFAHYNHKTYGGYRFYIPTWLILTSVWFFSVSLNSIGSTPWEIIKQLYRLIGFGVAIWDILATLPLCYSYIKKSLNFLFLFLPLTVIYEISNDAYFALARKYPLFDLDNAFHGKQECDDKNQGVAA